MEPLTERIATTAGYSIVGGLILAAAGTLLHFIQRWRHKQGTGIVVNQAAKTGLHVR